MNTIQFFKKHNITNYTIDNNDHITVNESLWLSYKITELPKDFGSNLTINGHLYLSDNNLTELPTNFGTNLTIHGNLNLRHNNLTSLPESFSDITINGLDYAIIYHQLPKNICQYKNHNLYMKIDLSGNNFPSDYPETLDEVKEHLLYVRRTRKLKEILLLNTI